MSRRQTVLIIDDEEDAREFTAAVVSEVGDFEIITASDGISGAQLAKDRIPDLVILDVMMPGQSGFMVFNDIRQDERLADTRVIMLTGVSEKRGIGFSGEDMGEYFGEKPFAFIDKPVEPKNLEDSVRAALGM